MQNWYGKQTLFYKKLIYYWKNLAVQWFQFRKRGFAIFLTGLRNQIFFILVGEHDNSFRAFLSLGSNPSCCDYLPNIRNYPLWRQSSTGILEHFNLGWKSIGNLKVGMFAFAWSPKKQCSQPCQFCTILPKCKWLKHWLTLSTGSSLEGAISCQKKSPYLQDRIIVIEGPAIYRKHWKI